MTTYRDYTNLPPSALPNGDGVNLVRTGYPDTKFEWDNKRWVQVETIGSEKAAAVTLQQFARKFSYDYSIDGGAVGTKTMRGGTIPKNAIVCGYKLFDCTSQLLDGGSDTATITCGLNTASDIVTDLGGSVTVNLIDDIPYVTGLVDASGVVKVATEKSMTMEIKTHALTGGKFDLYVTGFYAV